LSRWRSSLGGGLALLAAALFVTATPASASPRNHPKLDRTLNTRAESGQGRSRVIVVFKSALDASELKKLGGSLGRRLNLIGGQVIDLPNGELEKLANHPAVQSVHHDRPFEATMNRVAIATGARTVQQVLGYTGAGVGVAVIDSGVTPWHDDLQDLGGTPNMLTSGGQRVAAFVDFVNGWTWPYDDYGHGTHVSGTIAGNGYDSLLRSNAGMAPDAHLVSLKVLDGNGRGVISNVIAALEYVVANRLTYNIRVVNLSVGAAVTESYRTDPLALAAKRAVDAGIVVVAAAGNHGTNALGQPQYGGITAPGNAPWVLTVGASSHEGTLTRVDDVVAGYSSRGPTHIDFAAKPDVVAYGTGIVSLSNRRSLLYETKPSFLLSGSHNGSSKPYLSLSGTSMAAPVVSGTVALMMQANPNLTPNLVKAILQYTAEQHASYNALTQGAGFLNSRGAVDLALYFASALPGQRYPSSSTWSRRVIWGNQRIRRGAISPSANAWKLGTVWGASSAQDGRNIVWGTQCETEDCDNIVWGTFEDGDNIVWGTSHVYGYGVVWGASCATVPLPGEDCDNIVWGTAEDEDNIVWGTMCSGEDCDNIVWGTDCSVQEDCDNIVWGTATAVVWGADCYVLEDCDNIVWGTGTVDEVLFPVPTEAEVSSWASFVWNWEALFLPPAPAVTPTATEPTTTTLTTEASSTTVTTQPLTTTTTTIVGGLQ
jgi:serine protease AprX